MRVHHARSGLAMLKLLIEKEKTPSPRCAEIASATWPSRHHCPAFSEYLFLLIVRLRSGDCVVSMGKDDKPKGPEDPPERVDMPSISTYRPTEDRYALSGLEDLLKEPTLLRSQDPLVAIVERIQVGGMLEGVQALRDFIKLLDDRSERDQRQQFREVEVRQGSYLAASGTLTQFNGILAVALAGALATLELGSLRFAVSAALFLHLFASVILCWAARPIKPKHEPTPTMAFFAKVALADRTFRTYRRGWRLTMLALVVTTIASVLLGLKMLGISPPLSILFG